MQTNQKRRYEEYDYIELTESEIDDALGYRRMLKAIALEKNTDADKRRHRIEKAQIAWTYDELRSEVLQRASQLPFQFDLDDNNKRVIDLLCLYFTGDERFNYEFFEYRDGKKMQMNLKKGIGLISSNKGTGKSILMTLFQQNKHRPFLCMPTKAVSEMFSNKGNEAIAIHSELLDINPMLPTFFYMNKAGICFDDLGFEIPKNSWGNKSDVMADVLFTIYSKNQMKGDFSWFHFTSNLSGKNFEDRYDDRIRDRMREMFNVIVLSGDSRRK